MTLTNTLLDKGYCLTVDNLYSSPQLADLLISHLTDVYGTVRFITKRNDTTIAEIQTEKTKKGDIIVCQRGKITAMVWNDMKNVSLISSIHTLKMVEVEKRGEIKKRRECAIAYNGRC